MDETLGLTLKRIRKAKNIEAKALKSGEISYSHLLKFEKGESSITLEKFFALLQEMNITAEEFEETYFELKGASDLLFNKYAVQAFWEGNLSKLNHSLTKEKQALKIDSENQQLKLNIIQLKALLTLLNEKNHLTKKELDELFRYLKSMNEWSRYEIWLFSCCTELFNPKQIVELIEKLVHPSTQMIISAYTQDRANVALLNAVSALIAKHYLEPIYDIFKYLDAHIRSDLDMHERASLMYHKKLLEFCKKPTDESLTGVENCINAFRIFGCYSLADSASDELKKYQNEYCI